jgi:two-component system chemotaxis response regulator CheY
MRSLVVEDDRGIRELVRRFLAPHGTCDVAPNGLVAVEVVRSSLEGGATYDLILVDLVMPGIDGLEVVQRIRKLEERHLPVGGKPANIIIMTARDSSQTFADIQELDCSGCLLKPFTRSDFFDGLGDLGVAVDR